MHGDCQIYEAYTSQTHRSVGSHRRSAYVGILQASADVLAPPGEALEWSFPQRRPETVPVSWHDQLGAPWVWEHSLTGWGGGKPNQLLGLWWTTPRIDRAPLMLFSTSWVLAAWGQTLLPLLLFPLLLPPLSLPVLPSLPEGSSGFSPPASLIFAMLPSEALHISRALLKPSPVGGDWWREDDSETQASKCSGHSRLIYLSPWAWSCPRHSGSGLSYVLLLILSVQWYCCIRRTWDWFLPIAHWEPRSERGEGSCWLVRQLCATLTLDLATNRPGRPY